MATDYVKQFLDRAGMLPGSVDPSAKGLYDQLNQYLASLSQSQRAYLMDTYATLTQDSSPFGVNVTGLLGIQQGDLQTLANDIQQLTGKSQMKGANARVPGSVETQRAYEKANPQPGMGASPAQLGLTGATPDPGTPGTPGTPPMAAALTEQSGLTQQQYVDLMRLWGLTSTREVDDMIGAYRQSYEVTYSLNQNADFVAGPNVQGGPTADAPSSPFAAYQQETKALGTQGVGQSPWTMTLQRQPDYSDMPPAFQKMMAHEGTEPTESQRLLTPQDVYSAVMYSSGSGGIAQRILQQYREKYLNATGTDMPADLAKQVQDAIAGLSPSDQQQWLEESIARPGGSIAIPALDNVLATYEQVHPTPSAQEQQEQLAITQAFQQALGRAPNSDELKALGAHPSPQQISDYINTLPMPGYPGMTYGQYQAVAKNMTSLWEQSFGKPPTQQELMWGVGKSQSQLQDFVNNSPSQIPGVTIGRYNDLTSWISSTATSGATTHAFSAGVDDSLVQSLHHQLQSASTQQPKPGPMNGKSP